MVNRLLVPLLLAALVVTTGCSSSDMPSASELLAGAHNSLEQNDTKTAGVWLGSARERLDSDLDYKEYAMLDAELALRTGAPGAARVTAEELLAQYPHDPRIHELAGKSMLATGAFDEAVSHLDYATNRYENEEDAARATDLLHLARGFRSYAEGDLASAQDHWLTIRDPQLQEGVRHATSRGGSEDAGGSNASTFARSQR
jgi:outer membrane protein assembly factor BamD (BamD/ComL family)